MSHPKNYKPLQGQMYQILRRDPKNEGAEWKRCGYARSEKGLNFLLNEYADAYKGSEFMYIKLPENFWTL